MLPYCGYGNKSRYNVSLLDLDSENIRQHKRPIRPPRCCWRFAEDALQKIPVVAPEMVGLTCMVGAHRGLLGATLTIPNFTLHLTVTSINFPVSGDLLHFGSNNTILYLFCLIFRVRI